MQIDPETVESRGDYSSPWENIIVMLDVYRPPNQNSALFLDKFNDILSRISKDNK